MPPPMGTAPAKPDMGPAPTRVAGAGPASASNAPAEAGNKPETARFGDQEWRGNPITVGGYWGHVQPGQVGRKYSMLLPFTS